MGDNETPFPLSELKNRAPWWPHSAWATWQRIRTGRMAAIRDGRRIFVTVELLRRYLEEHVAKESRTMREANAGAV